MASQVNVDVVKRKQWKIIIKEFEQSNCERVIEIEKEVRL